MISDLVIAGGFLLLGSCWFAFFLVVLFKRWDES